MLLALVVETLGMSVSLTGISGMMSLPGRVGG